MRAYFKGLTFWKEHPHEADSIVAREYHDTAEGIARQLEGLKLLDERDNVTAFTFAAGFSSIYGNMRQIGKFILKHQKLKDGQPPLDTDKLIERKFIKKMNEEKIAPTLQ